MAVIYLQLEVTDSARTAEIRIEEAEEDIRKSGIEHSAEVSNIIESSSNAMVLVGSGGDLYRAVGDLLARLSALQQVMDTLSGVSR